MSVNQYKSGELKRIAGASSVEVTAIQTTGTHIADISVNGSTTELYAPEGGGGGGSASIPTLTQDEYNTLVSAGSVTLSDGTVVTYSDDSLYYVTTPDGSVYTATYVEYGNTASGLTATTVQGAIDEVVEHRGVGFLDSTTSMGIAGTWTATENCWVRVQGQSTIKSYAGTPIELTVNGVSVFLWSYDYSSALNQFCYVNFTFPVKKGDSVSMRGNAAAFYRYKMTY